MAPLRHEAILRGDWRPEVVLDKADGALVLQMYRFMLRLRQCEIALTVAYRTQTEIRCPVHFCVGQEAVPAALSALVRPQDFMFCHHRSHGYYLAKSSSMRALFAELFGRQTGANGGLAGSQEISMMETNFYSGAILTGAVAIAVGVALGFQLKKSNAAVYVGFGEGATDEGIFWEAIGYASLRRLPIVFICENNNYTTFAPQPKHQPTEIHHRVASFGVESTAVFGNDVAELHRTLNAAAHRAHSGAGPTFIEAYTYRWNGHVGPESDAEVGYRNQDEIDFWKSYCPIGLLEEAMQKQGMFDAAVKERFLQEIDAEIQDAFAFARESPFPRNANWQELNSCGRSPEADRLLHDVEAIAFNQNQQDAMPGPY